MRKIFISYRREDSGDCSGRIRDRLVFLYGPDDVFMDVEDIPPGEDFRAYVAEQIARCEVVLAVIGPKWSGQLPDGKTRLAEPDDPVRVELETAFAKARRIVPVLVGGVKMPQPTDLPERLHGLSYLNAATVGTGADFHPNVDRLIARLEGSGSLTELRAAVRRAIAEFSLKRPLGRVAAVAGIGVIGATGAYAHREKLFPPPERPLAVMLLAPRYEHDQSERMRVNDLFEQIWALYFDGLSQQRKLRAIPNDQELHNDGSTFRKLFLSPQYSSMAVLNHIGAFADNIKHRIEQVVRPRVVQQGERIRLTIDIGRFDHRNQSLRPLPEKSFDLIGNQKSGKVLAAVAGYRIVRNVVAPADGPDVSPELQGAIVRIFAERFRDAAAEIETYDACPTLRCLDELAGVLAKKAGQTDAPRSETATAMERIRLTAGASAE